MTENRLLCKRRAGFPAILILDFFEKIFPLEPIEPESINKRMMQYLLLLR
jgi:hypothetical protein